MAAWRSPESWTLEVPLTDGTLRVERGADEIRLEGASVDGALRLDLAVYAEGPQYDREADAAFERMQSYFGKPFRPLITYRSRVTWVLGILFAGHLVYLALLLWAKPPIQRIGLYLPLLAWATLGAWLHGAYFP